MITTSTPTRTVGREINSPVLRPLTRNVPIALDVAFGAKILMVQDLERNDLDALADWFEGATRY